MLLIYSPKITPRISYIFKHVCTRLLGIEVGFTSVIEEFVSHSGPKLSYGKKPLGNEMFLQSYGLLSQQGFDSIDIMIRNWEETKCFFLVGKLSTLPFDIFSASFYLLSRYEEYLPHVKDEKGRFLASESLAFKGEFLQFPVVDIWAYKFKEALLKAFPEMGFPVKSMKVHNLISASQPFAYKYKGLLRSVSGYVRDITKLKLKNIFARTSVLLGIKEDPYNTFTWIINAVKNSQVNLTVFFLLGESINFIEGINSKQSKFKYLLKSVADYKEVGLHFSLASLTDFNTLKKEKKQLESITNRELISAMNIEYLVSLPDNYRNLIELEVERDFTLVYEKTPGFRASTCTPYLFYDLDYEIVTPLVIHPIALTTKAFKGMSDSEITAVIAAIIGSVKKVNGTFSMVFTNKNFTKSNRNDIWKNLFLNLNNKKS